MVHMLPSCFIKTALFTCGKIVSQSASVPMRVGSYSPRALENWPSGFCAHAHKVPLLLIARKPTSTDAIAFQSLSAPLRCKLGLRSILLTRVPVFVRSTYERILHNVPS